MKAGASVLNKVGAGRQVTLGGRADAIIGGGNAGEFIVFAGVLVAVKLKPGGITSEEGGSLGNEPLTGEVATSGVTKAGAVASIGVGPGVSEEDGPPGDEATPAVTAEGGVGSALFEQLSGLSSDSLDLLAAGGEK